MNLTFSLIFLFVALPAWSKDKPKAMLFIDTNDGKTEIAVARQMAEARGQKLIVFPVNEEDYNTEIDKNENLIDLLKEAEITSVTLSGHNGGSDFSGTKTKVSTSQMLDLLDKSGAKQSVKSLYLLGCNGGNKAKLFFWKGGLPDLKFIMGYDGSAPLSKDVEGVEFYEDVLKKEDSILGQINAADLQVCLQDLKNVNMYSASLLVNCKEDDYVFLSKRPEDEKFGKLDTKECAQKNNEFKEKYLKEIMLYWSGEKEIPADTATGFLREAYTYFRQNEHCFGGGDDVSAYDMDGDSMLFLLFNKNFNKNALKYYRPLLSEFLAELEQVMNSPEAFRKQELKKHELVLKKLKAFKSKPNILDKKVAIELKAIKAQMDKISSNPLVKSCEEQMTSVQQCMSVIKELVLLVSLKDQKKEIENYKAELENSINKVSAKIEVLESTRLTPEALATYAPLKENVLKLLNSPDSVTRKDLMGLDHMIAGYYPFDSFTQKTIAVYAMAAGISSLDSKAFPFSWHDFDQEHKIEEPWVYGSVDYLRNRQGKFVDKELSELSFYLTKDD